MKELAAGVLTLAAVAVISELVRPKRRFTNERFAAALHSGGLERAIGTGILDYSSLGTSGCAAFTKCSYDQAIERSFERCAKLPGKYGAVCGATTIGMKGFGDNVHTAYRAIKGLF